MLVSAMIKSVNLSLQHSIPAAKLAITVATELDFSQGIIGIYGGSGQGKSTLLKLWSGLIESKHTHLDWRLDASDRAKVRAKVRAKLRHRLAQKFTPEASPCVYQPQDACLFETMTVGQNLTLVNQHSKWRDWQVIEMNSVIEMCGIEHLLRQSVASLSGGEKQRVALARSLLSGKPILLLDEPFSALDWQARTELHSRLRTLQQQSHLAIVIVSHSLTELAMICQTLLHIEQGKIVQQGSTSQLLPKLIELSAAPTFSRLLVEAPNVLCEHQLTRWNLVRSEQYVYEKQVKKINKRKPTPNIVDKTQVKPLLVPADKVSISLQLQHDSSVLNQLEGRIKSIIRSVAVAMIELDIDGQRLDAEISSWSLDKLALAEGQRVFAQFKAL